MGQRDHSVLANGDFYKLAIETNGIYKIDRNFLKKHGIDLEGIDPRNISLYGNGGGVLPQPNAAFRHEDLTENAILIFGEDDGSFDKEDYILFYAEGPDKQLYDPKNKILRLERNLYDRLNYYFLHIGDGPGLRIQDKASEGIRARVMALFDEWVYWESNETNILGSGRQWFALALQDPESFELRFEKEGMVDHTSIKLFTSLMSTSARESRFRLHVNGQAVGETVLDGVRPFIYGWKGEQKEESFSVAIDQLSGLPKVNATISFESEIEDPGYIDYFVVNFKRHLRLYDNYTAFRSITSLNYNFTEFVVGGATPEMAIWDVSDPLLPKNQIFQLNGERATFRTDTRPLREFIAFQGSEFPTPDFVGRVENQDLHGLEVPELLIITTQELSAEAVRLASFRENHSFISAEVVTVDQIYNEFSSGKQDVTAIRDFVRHLYRRSGKLRYLLLFGDASFDYLDRKEGNTNIVPTYQSFNSLHNIHSYVSDDYFGFMDEGEGAWPESGSIDNSNYDLDIGIGRLPVSDLTQARTVVDKIIHYDQSKESMGAWRNRMAFVADDGEANKFLLQSDFIIEDIENRFKTFNPDKIYIDAYPQNNGWSRAGRKKIDDAIKEGVLILDFMGHGGETAWTNENILDLKLINSWRNLDNLALFFTATCEFGRFDDFKRTSGAETAVLSEKGGAIAMFTTTRPVFLGTNFEVSKAFYNHVFNPLNNEMPRLGDVMRLTKNDSRAGTVNRNFALLGDPSLMLAYPRQQIEITGVEPGDSLRPLEKVTITGNVVSNHEKDGSFDGELELVLYDQPSLRQTLGDEGDPIVNFYNREDILFKGRVSVVRGDFKAQFVVPKSVSLEPGNGKISLYAKHTTALTDASGYYDQAVIGGEPVDAENDRTPPKVELFLEDLSFNSGGRVSANPLLIAKFRDNSGINTTADSLHRILGYLDYNFENPIELSSFFIADLDTYQEGTLHYQLSNLSPGEHHLLVEASDTHNNRGGAEVIFQVIDSAEVILKELRAFPNPGSDYINFGFDYQNSPQDLKAVLMIYSPGGNYLKTIEKSLEIREPLDSHSDQITLQRNLAGYRLDRGFYYYKFFLKLGEKIGDSAAGRFIFQD